LFGEETVEKALVLFLFLALLTSCATTSTDLKRNYEYPEATIVVGKINVLVNGSDEDIAETLAGKCHLTILNESEAHKYRLDKSGEFYLVANSGTFIIRSLKCGTGIFSDSSHLFHPQFPATVLEKGSINYVGDLTINWKLGDSEFSLARFLGESGTVLNRYGGLDIGIQNNNKTLQAFLKSHYGVEKKAQVTKLFKVIDSSKF
jgi:hypothetical protein